MKVYIIEVRSDNGGMEYFLDDSLTVFSDKKKAEKCMKYMNEQFIAMFGEVDGSQVFLQLVEGEINTKQIYVTYSKKK